MRFWDYTLMKCNLTKIIFLMIVKMLSLAAGSSGTIMIMAGLEKGLVYTIN